MVEHHDVIFSQLSRDGVAGRVEMAGELVPREGEGVGGLQ